MRLLLPFVVLPIVEIALFIQVGGLIGALPTIGLVILSSVLGISVMRRQGMLAAMDVQRAMQEFRDPARQMAQGALMMIAGLLLLVPGLFTSALGLLLLVPFCATCCCAGWAAKPGQPGCAMNIAPAPASISVTCRRTIAGAAAGRPRR